MSSKHTGNKILQQDTIDAINNMIKEQQSLFTQNTQTQSQLADIELKLKTLITHAEITTDEIIDT